MAWTNNKKEQNEWVETYLKPYQNKWKEYGISIAMNYYDGRLEDGSGRLTDVVKCDKCGFKWKDLLNEPKECPCCKGLAEKRDSTASKKNYKILDPNTNKKLQNDEAVIYRALVEELNFSPTTDFLINYRKDGYLESDFYIPNLDINIECQGEQHFFPVDIKDDPNKSNDDRDFLLINQIIRDVKKFKDIYHERVLYYINTDNIRVDEFDFIERAKKSIEDTINKQITSEELKKHISNGIYKRYLPNTITSDNFREYIMSYINKMYKNNRIFKHHKKLCEIIKRYINKN